MATLPRSLCVEAKDLRSGWWNKTLAALLLGKERGTSVAGDMHIHLLVTRVAPAPEFLDKAKI